MISREQFIALLNLEVKAHDLYDEMLLQIGDEQIRKNLESIRDDEIRHIELAKRLLEIIGE